MALGTTAGHYHFKNRQMMYHSKKTNNRMHDDGSAGINIDPTEQHSSLLFAMRNTFREKLAVRMKGEESARTGHRAQEQTLSEISEKSRKIVKNYKQRIHDKHGSGADLQIPRESSWSGTNRMRKLPPISLRNKSSPSTQTNLNLPLNDTENRDHRTSQIPAGPALSKYFDKHNSGFDENSNDISQQKHNVNLHGNVGNNTHTYTSHKGLDKENDDDSPPNMMKLRALSNKKKELLKLNKKKTATSPNLYGRSNIRDDSQSLSDFQKWQLQQDTERQNRLNKHREIEKQNSPPLGKSIEIDCEPYTYSTKPGNIQSQRISQPLLNKPKRFFAKDQRKQDKLKHLRQHYPQRDPIICDDTDRSRVADLMGDDRSIVFNKTYSKQHGLSEQMRNFQNNHKKKEILSDEHITAKAGFPKKPSLLRRDGRSTAGSTISNKSASHQQQKNTNQTTETQTYTNTVTKPQEKYEFPQYDHDNVPIHHNTVEIPEHEVVEVVPCNICGRKFARDRLSAHVAVCAKASSKKRRVFNMTKARKKGTDLETFTIVKGNSKPRVKQHNSNWRDKHEDFIKTIRHAKMLSSYVAGGGNINDLPPPEPSKNSDYITCQYCERRFAPKVADRHIPRCKDIKCRPPPPKTKFAKRK